MKRLVLIVLLLGLGQSPISVADQNLIFGVYTSDKASTMYKTFKPVIDALEQSLTESLQQPVRISLKIYKSYDEGLQAIITGDADFMRMGAASYVLAKQQNNAIQLLAMELRKGKKTFKGEIITAFDSPIERLDQLKGKRFAFGNKNSTIGRYFAQAALVDAGIHSQDLSASEYLNRHDKVAYAVSLKDFDAGSVKDKTFKKFAAKQQVKAIYSFDVATKPWLASSLLDPSLATELSRALLQLKDPAVLKILKVDGFASATDADYDSVRNAMDRAKFF